MGDSVLSMGSAENKVRTAVQERDFDISEVLTNGLQREVDGNVSANGNSIGSEHAAVNGTVVRGGWDELPHNMGSLAAQPLPATGAEDASNSSGKVTKKRAAAKPRAKRNASTKGDIAATNDHDTVDGGATEQSAIEKAVKPAPKKRAPRKKAALAEDVEMEDVMQDAPEVADAKPPPKKRGPRKKATPKAATSQDNEAQVIEEAAIPLAKPAPKKRAAPKKKAAHATDIDGKITTEEEGGNDASLDDVPEVEPITPAKTPRKRAPAKKKAAADGVKTEGDADEDSKGAVATLAPKTPKPRAPRKKAAQQPSPAESINDDGVAALKDETPKVTVTRKRARKGDDDGSESGEQKPKRKRASRAKVDTSDDVVDQVNKLIDSVEGDAKVKKPKAVNYGITPGETPYPDWPLPTAEACYEVNKLLSDVHGVVEPPKTIPAPSLEVSGCGEVPSVLDALIRTRLSAATTGTNAGYAFQGLVEKFGIMDSGIGKGSVNWNKVREADQEDIEEAIKRGGLANTKSKSIKALLEMVHEQNLQRREAFKKEKEEGVKADVVGADSLPESIKDLEIASADQDVLSLQFVHGLDDNEAMQELTKFPGIGVKTASCVILFCLRRPSFAVDTHVFRLCKWLKWIPENATRDKTFSHCEVRIPHELKYSLHQLFIRHGKTCGRCRAATSMSNEAWDNANCPIEHLVTRTGVRKMFKPAPKTPKKKGKKSKKTKEDDEEETESELSEHEDDEFEDLLSGESDQLPQTPEGDDDGNASEAETEILDENMDDVADDDVKEGQ